MKVRGERECQDCGSRWSYFDTGSVECPDCGSLRSVGIEERQHHTDAPATLDLTAVRNSLEDGTGLDEVAAAAADECREYARKRGFIDAGTLRVLDDTYVGARVLAGVGNRLARSLRVDDEEELFFLTLLRGVDHGELPAASEVPSSLRDAWALALTTAVTEYRRDVRTVLSEDPDDGVTAALTTLAEHVKRVEALDGDVPPAESQALLSAARDIGRAVVDGDEAALATASDRLDRLGP